MRGLTDFFLEIWSTKLREFYTKWVCEKRRPKIEDKTPRINQARNDKGNYFCSWPVLIKWLVSQLFRWIILGSLFSTNQPGRVLLFIDNLFFLGVEGGLIWVFNLCFPDQFLFHTPKTKPSNWLQREKVHCCMALGEQ